LDFLINNVKPYIDSRFRTKPDRINTGIADSSLGGLFSFYAAMKNQDIFGKAAVFSPSFWFCESFIFDFALKTTPKHGDFRVYLVGGGNEGRNMVPNIMRMHSQLLSQGYTHVTYTIDPDGTHTEQFWSKEFTDAYNYTYIINL
jgi:predicted alpha/beta superfamily hydrolase